jgi:ribosome-associated translation inhibitor RaiA
MADVDPGIVGAQPPEGFQLDIRATGFALTEAVRTYANEHIGGRLAKHSRAIQAVVVRLGDVNGPKGGVDKRCGVEVTIRRGSEVVVEEIDSDLHAAMDRAADRIVEAVSRELSRKRTMPRQQARKVIRERKLMH